MKNRTQQILLVSTLLALHHGSAPGNGQPVRVDVEPRAVLVERTASAQLVSFDLSIENLGAEPLRLARIELSVYDRRGDLELHKFLTSSGLRHGDDSTVELAPNSSAFLFNPFESFSPDVELARLRYELFFESGDAAKELAVSVSVEPAVFTPKTGSGSRSRAGCWFTTGTTSLPTTAASTSRTRF